MSRHAAEEVGAGHKERNNSKHAMCTAHSAGRGAAGAAAAACAGAAGKPPPPPAAPPVLPLLPAAFFSCFIALTMPHNVSRVSKQNSHSVSGRTCDQVEWEGVARWRGGSGDNGSSGGGGTRPQRLVAAPASSKGSSREQQRRQHRPHLVQRVCRVDGHPMAGDAAVYVCVRWRRLPCRLGGSVALSHLLHAPEVLPLKPGRHEADGHQGSEEAAQASGAAGTGGREGGRWRGSSAWAVGKPRKQQRAAGDVPPRCAVPSGHKRDPFPSPCSHLRAAASPCWAAVDSSRAVPTSAGKEGGATTQVRISTTFRRQAVGRRRAAPSTLCLTLRAIWRP